MSFFSRLLLSFFVSFSLVHASCDDDGEKMVTRVRLFLSTKIEFGAEVPLLPFDHPFVQLVRRELKTVASLSMVLFINDKPVYMKGVRLAPLPQNNQLTKPTWSRNHAPNHLVYVFEHTGERWTIALRPL